MKANQAGKTAGLGAAGYRQPAVAGAVDPGALGFPAASKAGFVAAAPACAAATAGMQGRS
jgi:hypothetical protein